MATKNQNTGVIPPGNSQDTVLDVIEFDNSEDYQGDAIPEIIEEKYGGLARYAYIYLHRKKGDIWKLLRTYQEPPDMQDIINMYGGGEFRIWIVFFNKQNARKPLVKIFNVEGPEKMPPDTIEIPGQIQQPVNTVDPEEAAINKLLKYKQLFGTPAGDSSNGVIDVVIKSMEGQTKILSDVIKNMNAPTGGNDSKVLDLVLPILLKNGLESDFDKALRINKVLNNNSKENESGDIGMKDVIQLAGPILAKIFSGPQAPAPGVNGTAAIPATTNGGGSDLDQIKNAIQYLAETQDKNLQAINKNVFDLKTNVSVISDKVSFIDEYLEETDPDYKTDAIEAPGEAGNVQTMEVVEQNNTETKTEPEMTDKQKGAILKVLPIAQQAEYLKDWYEKGSSLEQIFGWCLLNDVYSDPISGLKQFNEVVKRAGMPEYIPQDKQQ